MLAVTFFFFQLMGTCVILVFTRSSPGLCEDGLKLQAFWYFCSLLIML